MHLRNIARNDAENAEINRGARARARMCSRMCFAEATSSILSPRTADAYLLTHPPIRLWLVFRIHGEREKLVDARDDPRYGGKELKRAGKFDTRVSNEFHSPAKFINCGNKRAANFRPRAIILAGFADRMTGARARAGGF